MACRTSCPRSHLQRLREVREVLRRSMSQKAAMPCCSEPCCVSRFDDRSRYRSVRFTCRHREAGQAHSSVSQCGLPLLLLSEWKVIG